MSPKTCGVVCFTDVEGIKGRGRDNKISRSSEEIRRRRRRNSGAEEVSVVKQGWL